MIYNIESLRSTQVNINGKWVIARPVNHKYRTTREKIKDAWAVFSGRADAVRFEGE